MTGGSQAGLTNESESSGIFAGCLTTYPRSGSENKPTDGCDDCADRAPNRQGLSEKDERERD
jgi:hypothetical protein